MADLGQCACQAPDRLNSSDLGRAQNAHSTESGLCRLPKNLNLSSLDLGTAQDAGPTLDSTLQSNLEPEQCRLGNTHAVSRGKPSVAETL